MKDLYYCESGDHYYTVYDNDWRFIYEYETDHNEDYANGDFIIFIEKDCPNHTQKENEQ